MLEELAKHEDKFEQLTLNFEEEAKKAVKQWRYEPATLDGMPLEVPFQIVVTFYIR